MDNGWAPYGNKSEESIERRMHKILDPLIVRCDPDIIIIACNTASTFILPSLRAKTAIPIIGVIPPVKPGASLSKNKAIGLLATPATVTRPYTKKLIDDFAKDCEISAHGSTKLVEIAENKLQGQKVCLKELKKEITPLFENKKIDVVLLGCTHFPHIKKELEEVSPWPVIWIDSAKAISRRLQSLLGEITPSTSRNSNNRVFSTIPMPEHLRAAFERRQFDTSEPTLDVDS